MPFKIAIPTDFSEHAARAARFVLELFREDDCTFYLMHTYTPSFLRAEYLIHSPGQIGLGDFYRERVMRKLNAFEKELRPLAGKQHKFYTHAAFNNLDAELNDMVHKEALDLIAMGTQGATGAKEVLFGTHAVQVMHRADCPVLVIPEKAEVQQIRDILFPTDYAPDYSSLQLSVLDRLLEGPGRKLHFLHAYTGADSRPERQKSREQLKKRYAKRSTTFTETGQQGVVEAINNFAAEQPVQLLVLVRNRHSMLENILVQPLIDRIGFHAEIPFMVIPPEPGADGT